MNEIENILEDAENAIQKAALQEPGEAQTTLLATIKMLKTFIEKQPDARIFYALGCCWYDMPYESPERILNVKMWLTRALEMNPSHHFARLYLGHYFFDNREYGIAHELFCKIPYGYFKNYHQEWRDIKRQELVLCCEFYTNTKKITIENMASLQEVYVTTTEEERPVPIEFIICILWASEKGLITKEIFGELIKWLKRLEYIETCFSEIQLIEQFVTNLNLNRLT